MDNPSSPTRTDPPRIYTDQPANDAYSTRSVADHRDERSIPELLKTLRDESSTLIRQELALAKAEMSEKASKAGKDLASIGIGAGVALVGAFGLVSALALALAALFNLALDFAWPNSLWLGWGIVGVALTIIGVVMLKSGVSDLKRQSPVPEKTVESLKEDSKWLASKTH
jgi:hypothetical protein